MRHLLGIACIVAMLMAGKDANAASSAHLDGASLSLLWSLPFAGMLLSIALFPLVAPRLWEHHFAAIAACWAAAFIAPCAVVFGGSVALTEVLHTLAVEYVPFILLLYALFVVAGGIRIVGNLVGTPGTNTAILGIGTVLASFLGTTGASMLLIRPVIRANASRRQKVHVFVFFIFLVSNIGGSLTPLGDPPLFLGFLKGVDFLWPATAMALPMAVASVLLLALFYFLDRRFWVREAPEVTAVSAVPRRIRVEGIHNFVYLAGIVGAVLLSGIWDGGDIPIGLGIVLPVSGLARDLILIVLAYLSLKTTRPAIRVENAFTWVPIREVAVLFIAIFVTMIPALAVLRAGHEGALAPLLSVMSTPDGRPIDIAYFWLTGFLSSFLDNAPTYLVFFNLAGGDAATLMGPLASTLLAISMGAVFMGANTYIGNAPNFMVKAICEERGIRMPSFFAYMGWSGAILLPVFALLTLIFF